MGESSEFPLHKGCDEPIRQNCVWRETDCVAWYPSFGVKVKAEAMKNFPATMTHSKLASCGSLLLSSLYVQKIPDCGHLVISKQINCHILKGNSRTSLLGRMTVVTGVTPSALLSPALCLIE